MLLTTLDFFWAEFHDFLGFWPTFPGFLATFPGFLANFSWVSGHFFRILRYFGVFRENRDSGPRNRYFSTPNWPDFPTFGRFPRFGQIRPDSARFGQISRPDLARFGQIRPDSARFGQIRPDSARFGQIRPDSARFLGFGPFWPGGVPVREFRPPLGGVRFPGGPRIGTNPVGVG